jgi:hypothetical protein
LVTFAGQYHHTAIVGPSSTQYHRTAIRRAELDQSAGGEQARLLEPLSNRWSAGLPVQKAPV